MKTTCPRRMEEMGPWPREEGLDTFINDRCSFCGSLSPELFLERVKAGDELGPTDKNYKVYIHKPPWGKFYFQHFSPEQCEEFVALLNDKKLHIGYPGRFYVLPFFIRVEPRSDEPTG